MYKWKTIQNLACLIFKYVNRFTIMCLYLLHKNMPFHFVKMKAFQEYVCSFCKYEKRFKNVLFDFPNMENVWKTYFILFIWCSKKHFHFERNQTLQKYASSFIKNAKYSKTCFFTLNRWKMLNNVFIHFVHKNHFKNMFFHFVIHEIRLKKSFFYKNEKSSTSVFSVCPNEIASKTSFSFWYIRSSSKTCINILVTWKALHKRVFSLSKRNRFENVFFHFVREKTFKNIFLILLTWKALRKRIFFIFF